MTQRSLEQERAANALTRVQELAERNREDKFRSCYRSYVDRFAPSVLMMGLGQALATERAAAGAKPKKEDQRAHDELYKSLQQWLCRQDGGVYPGAHDLLEALSEGSEDQYLLAQAEALAWLQWHKKFCRAEFHGEGGPED